MTWRLCHGHGSASEPARRSRWTVAAHSAAGLCDAGPQAYLSHSGPAATSRSAHRDSFTDAPQPGPLARPEPRAAQRRRRPLTVLSRSRTRTSGPRAASDPGLRRRPPTQPIPDLRLTRSSLGRAGGVRWSAGLAPARGRTLRVRLALSLSHESRPDLKPPAQLDSEPRALRRQMVRSPGRTQHRGRRVTSRSRAAAGPG